MKTTEQVYALFVEANPVADADRLSTESGSSDQMLRLVDDAGLEGDPGWRANPEASKRRWKPTLIAAAIVLIVGAVSFGAAWVATGGGGPVAAELASMHVVFDGASCAYHGPDQLLAGEAIVKVERSPGAEDVAFLVPRLVDESVGFDEVRDWAAVHPAQAVPPFIDWRWEIVYLTDDARHEAFAITLEPGRYLVTCNTAPGGTDRAHPAAVLSVMSE